MHGIDFSDIIYNSEGHLCLSEWWNGNIRNENVTLCCFNSNAKMSAKEFPCITFIWTLCQDPSRVCINSSLFLRLVFLWMSTRVTNHRLQKMPFLRTHQQYKTAVLKAWFTIFFFHTTHSHRWWYNDPFDFAAPFQREWITKGAAKSN